LGYCHHVALRLANANCPKRPSQNDFGTAFDPTGQPEMSQTQGLRELAHGHHPAKKIRPEWTAEICCRVGVEVTRLISNPVLIL